MIVNLCVPLHGILCSLKFCISASRNFSATQSAALWVSWWGFWVITCCATVAQLQSQSLRVG